MRNYADDAYMRWGDDDDDDDDVHDLDHCLVLGARIRLNQVVIVDRIRVGFGCNGIVRKHIVVRSGGRGRRGQGKQDD